MLTRTYHKVQISSKIIDLDDSSGLYDLQSLNHFESKYVLKWLFEDTERYFPLFS